jgi:hypothetical protein
MSRMIPYPRQTLDDRCDARQRPQIGTEPVSLSAFTQYLIQAPTLYRIDPRFSPGSTRSAKSGYASAFPESIPSHNTLPARLQRTRHSSHDGASNEHLDGFLPSLFEGLEIPERPQVNFLHSSMIAWKERNVTILCEAQ